MDNVEDGDIFFIASGIVCCSVCVPKGMSREVIERKVNEQTPTGIGSRWAVSADQHFATGEANPCICETDTERMHYLLNC